MKGAHSIVVPIDGSAFSLQALPAALGIIVSSGGSLHLLYVQPAPAPVFDARHAAETTTAIERQLQDLAGTLRARWKLEVAVAVRQGRPAEAIAAFAGETGAELIALTTHGRGGSVVSGSEAWPTTCSEPARSRCSPFAPRGRPPREPDRVGSGMCWCRSTARSWPNKRSRPWSE